MSSALVPVGLPTIRRSEQPAAPRATYKLSPKGGTITCLVCGTKSRNKTDVAEHYCLRCMRYHDEGYAEELAERERTRNAVPRKPVGRIELVEFR